jgi:transposase InsO family protein
MNFIIGLPVSSRSKGDRKKDAILVVINLFIKSVHYFMVTSEMAASQLADLSTRKLVLHGTKFPNSMATNRGTQFTSKLLTAVCYHLMLKCWLSTTNHPQTNGQIKWKNCILEQYLHVYVNYHQNKWIYRLPRAELAYNNSINSALGVLPYVAETGWNLRIDDRARLQEERKLVPNSPAAINWVQAVFKH